MAARKQTPAVTLESLNETLEKLVTVVATKDELLQVDERLTEQSDLLQRIMQATDAMVGNYDKLYVEYAAIKLQLSRYERWFEQLAKKTGTRLEY